MKKSVFIITIIAAFILQSVTVFAKAPVLKTSSFGINSIESMRTNGEYTIEIKREGTWVLAGKLKYDRFFRKQQLDLENFAKEGEKLEVRISQKGGGAAHMDGILLGGLAPEAIKGDKKGYLLKKLSKNDFDVADSYKKSFELVFKVAKEKKLLLKARVEAPEISKVPFQFPLSNLFREMGDNSHFYEYKIGSKGGDKSFFKEWSLTGSGHPSGYTYGYVSSDDKNLYVKIDFTPDNTMDGGKDYAKVYVDTKKGLREFKISEPEQKWGKVAFTYTDKVDYEHKVYDFTIPLRELGIKKEKSEAPLKLAFAAYGTASPGQSQPAIAYDSTNNRYLTAFLNISSNGEGILNGQFVNADGVLEGSRFIISDMASNYYYYPDLSYSSADDRFLVVWQDFRGGNYDIYGQFVNGTFGLFSTDFIISDTTGVQEHPRVAYDSTNSRFLVTWQDNRSGDSDIYGQFINAGFGLFSTNLGIYTSAGDQMGPDVSYGTTDNRFLVAWSSNGDVFGQFVNTGFGFYSTSFVISDATSTQGDITLSYDSVNNRFLAAFLDWRNGTADIYGQLIDANYGLYGTNFAISDEASFHQFAPVATFDSNNKAYLVAWRDSRSGTGVYGQVVKSDGSLFGTASDVNYELASEGGL